MTEPREVAFASLDEDTRLRIRGLLEDYLAGREEESTGILKKREASETLAVIWQAEKALRGNKVRVPDTINGKAAWILQLGETGPRVSVEKFRQNLLDAGVDPDIVNIAWGAAMSGGGDHFMRVNLGKA